MQQVNLPGLEHVNLGFHFLVSKQHGRLIQEHQTWCMEFLQFQPLVLAGYQPVQEKAASLAFALIQFQP